LRRILGADGIGGTAVYQRRSHVVRGSHAIRRSHAIRGGSYAIGLSHTIGRSHVFRQREPRCVGQTLEFGRAVAVLENGFAGG